MRTSTTALILSLISLLPTTTLAQCTAPVPCTDASLNALNTTDCQTYHAFILRGSDSGYPGHLGPLTKLVCSYLTSANASSTCGYENVVYPANSSYSGGPEGIWCRSAEIGATNGQKQLTEYAERCPDAKLILLGFSQGGSVALDVLGGGGGDVYGCKQKENGKLDAETSPGSHIVAAAVFGAVHRSANQSYTEKNGGQNFNGSTPRSSELLAGLSPYSNILRDYCNPGDPVCAPDSKNQAVDNHLSYFEKYNENAASFIVEKAKAAGAFKENGTAQKNETSDGDGDGKEDGNGKGDDGKGDGKEGGDVKGVAVGMKVEMAMWGFAFGAVVLAL